VDKLKGKLIVDLMNQMKQASKTGATGFGQLSDKERQLLENASTALQKGLSEKDAQRYLNQIKEKAQKVLGGNKKPIDVISPEDISQMSDEELMSLIGE